MSRRSPAKNRRPVDFEKITTALTDAIAHVECAIRYIESDDDAGPETPVLESAVRMLWQVHDELDGNPPEK